jgi:hypothetical protein
MIRMAIHVYNIEKIYTFDGIEIEITPLKIRYMRDLMDTFYSIDNAKTDDEAIDLLCECVRIAMKQYYPEFSKNTEDIQDNFDLATVYKILDISAGLKITENKNETVKEQTTSQESGSTWKDLDLSKLETEVFLLGIWKDYEELEKSLSIPELMTTIASRRELDYEEKKFLAAIQGVDLEGNKENSKGQKEWEDMKARVFSGGTATDSNDILALQGQNAVKAGFGIGMGLEYEVLSE